MNKAKLIVLIITILLLLTGVAYARWTEQINLLIQTKTAETELSYLDYSTRTESGSINVARGDGAQATVNFQNISPNSTNTVTIRFKNTGTIPIDIDDIKVLYVGGYSDTYKNDIWLTVSGYAGTKRFVQEDGKIFHWKMNGSASRWDELYELPVNGIIDIVCKVEFDDVMYYYNFGMLTDPWFGKPPQQIKENVSFVLKVEYERFNKK